MQVIIIGDDVYKKEFGIEEGADQIRWVSSITDIEPGTEAGLIIDLFFINDADHIRKLSSFLPRTIIINCVEQNLEKINRSFIRINGWPSFIGSAVLEASGYASESKAIAEEFFAANGKRIEWVTDQPGFITARVVSMIINEAFLALDEGVSSIEEIDIAMKLGTNYPFGPFEWAGKIGVHRVAALLSELSLEDPRYLPAPLLQQTEESC